MSLTGDKSILFFKMRLQESVLVSGVSLHRFWTLQTNNFVLYCVLFNFMLIKRLIFFKKVTFLLFLLGI